MSTATEITEAIRALSAAEREKLLQALPNVLPEIEGDVVWTAIINDPRPRPALTALLDETEAMLRENPEAFPQIAPEDFEKNR